MSTQAAARSTLTRLEKQASLNSAIKAYGDACRQMGRRALPGDVIDRARNEVKDAILRLVEAARVEGAELSAEP